MGVCSAVSCSNNTNEKIPGISFHLFPKDEPRRSEWVKAVSRVDWVPSKHSVLCSEHFEEKLLDHTMRNSILSPAAVPTIFPTFPPHRQKVKNPMKTQNSVKQDTSTISNQDIPNASNRDVSNGSDISAPIETIEDLPVSGYPSKAAYKRSLEETQLTINEKNKKIRILQQTIRRYKKKIENVSSLMMNCDAERLVACVENRPAIYDYNIKDHSNRIIVDKLWAEVADEMKVPVADCKAKWASLRASYNRAARETKGTPSDSQASKKWYLMDAMGFLKDFVGVHKKMESNITYSSELEPPEAEIEIISTDNEDFSYVVADSPLLNRDSITPAVSQKNTAAERVADPMIALLQSKFRDEKNESSTLTFFKSLVQDVDKLSESRKRKFKEEVLLTLHRHLDDQDNDSILCA